MDKKLTIQIVANTQKAVKEIENLKKEIETFSKDVEKNNKTLKEQEKQFLNIASSLKKIAVGFASFEVLKGAVSSVANFEQSLSRLGAISQASASQLEQLKQKAIELGGTTEYSSSQVVEGMNYLAMAGLKTNEILQSTADVLNLATIGQMDLARASDIASNILSGFALKADQMKWVVDVMATTITNANTNIEQLGEAMKYVAPTAHALGVSLEETSVAIGVLSNAGLQGSIAGTNLAMVLTRLTAPVGGAKEALKKLGVEVFDANGKFIGLQKSLLLLKDRLQGLSQQQKISVLKDIFGQEALKAVLVLLGEVDKSYSKLLNKVKNSSGASEKMAKQMRDTLQGAYRTLVSSLEKLALTIGQELLPAMTAFIKAVAEGVNEVTDFYNSHKELINAVALLGGSYLILNRALTAFTVLVGAQGLAQIGSFAGAIGLLTQNIKKLGVAILGLVRANPVLMALSGALLAVNALIDKEREEIEELNKATDKLVESNQKFNDILRQVQANMKFTNGRSELKLTAQQIDDLRKKTEKLKEETEKQIKDLQKRAEEGDNIWDKMLGLSKEEQYKREIDVLQKRLKTLDLIQKKLSTAKPFERTANSAVQASQKTEELTAKERNYLAQLNSRLNAEINNYKTLDQLRDEELKKAQQMLGNSKAFEKAKEQIVKTYAIKQLRNIKASYQERIRTHQTTINQLEQKEKELSAQIERIQKDLNKRLRTLELQRVNDIEEIENKIHQIKMAGVSDYEKYLDKQKQAEVLLSKAKEAIREGELQQARRYMNQYQTIVESLANTEIKEGEKIRVSRKEANQYAINALKKLEEVTNNYYARAKQMEKSRANEKLEHLRAELEATKAQMELELQRLQLEKQLVEQLTGKKIVLDTTEAENKVKELQAQIDELDKKLGNKKVEVDTTPAKQELEGVADTTQIKVEADATPAKEEVNQLKSEVENSHPSIKVEADTIEAVEKAKSFVEVTNELIASVKVKSDISDALKALDEIPRVITTTHYIKTIETHATGGLAGFRKYTGKIPGDDPMNSDDVPALLTRGEFVVRRDAVKHYGVDFLYRLNSKLLPKFATGGLVDIQRPQVLTSQLSSASSDFSSSFGEDLLAKLDKYLNTLRDLLSHFDGTNVPEKQKIVNLIHKVEGEKKRYEKDLKTREDYANSTRGKVMTEAEYAQYQSKLSSLDAQIKADEKRIEQLGKEVERMADAIERYLKEVEKYKDLIKKKLEQFGINPDDFLPPEFEYSMDLNRLKRYYSRLSRIRIPSVEQLKEDFRDYINYRYKTHGNEYIGVKSSFGGFAILNPGWKPMNYSSVIEDFFRKWAVKDPTLERRLVNVLSAFQRDATLTDDNAKRLWEDLLKKKIPRFQTGGIVNFQNGGKLPGYGGGDRRLALLEDGEFVIRKEAVRAFGTDFLHRINNLSLSLPNLPRFQTGGVVGDIPSTTGGTMNINFSFPDGKTFPLMGDEQVAKALATYLKKI
ncbi:MAG: phage tail tape measure protein [Epsilonproteobacteria bacterium]|nr:phage tail tape measure protein [Campylobacterota bacterium]